MSGSNIIVKALALLMGMLVLMSAQAEIFQCPDAAGALQFQNRPCAVVVQDEPDSGKHFLWQASVGKGTLYLLGSIHFGTAEMYPLPLVMTSMFKRSETLVVEADVLNVSPLEIAQLLASKAMYQDGTTLRQQLSEKTWQRLEQVAASLGMSVELLDMQKPWFVSMSLTALALKNLGFSEEKGIDIHFLSLARGKKKIVELEGLAWQLGLFEQLTPEEQVLMLEESLNEIEQGKDFFERMLAFWRAGDGAGIQALFDEGMLAEQASERLNQLIMLGRNKSMTEKLVRMAEQGGRYFVVVGAGHLPGDEGIIALLKQRGYQVSQL